MQGRPDPGDELQHLGGGDRRLHAGRGKGGGLRPHPPAHRSAGGAAGCARGVPQDRPRCLEDGGAGRLLHRPRQPAQPGAAPGELRGHEPVRRAAAAPVRRLQPRLDQRGAVRAGRERRLGPARHRRAPLHPLPRQRHRREPLPPPRDREPGATDPPRRSRRHGLGGSPGAPRHPVRLGRGCRAGAEADGLRGRGSEARLGKAGGTARRVPRMGEVHLGSGRDLRARSAGRAHQADALPAELQPDHGRTHGDDLDHRGLLVGDRAVVRRGIHAESGGRPDARCERGLRGDRPAGGVALGGFDPADRRGGAHPLPRGAREMAAGVRDRARCDPRMAHPHAGGVSGVHRFGDLEDLQLPPRGHRGGRGADLSRRLHAGLQGRDGVSRRVARESGAVHRRHGEAGTGAGDGAGAAHPRRGVGTARRARG